MYLSDNPNRHLHTYVSLENFRQKKKKKTKKAYLIPSAAPNTLLIAVYQQQQPFSDLELSKKIRPLKPPNLHLLIQKPASKLQ